MMLFGNTVPVALAVVLQFSVLLSVPAGAVPPEMEISGGRIDDLALRAVSELELPGMSLAVVTADRVLYSRAFGMRDITSGHIVDEDTIFPIASLTKAFTTLALALMVEDGRLEWDDPVQRYMPSFEMSDPYISREFTITDMLTHRSGLPLGAGDLLFWPDGDFTTRDVLAALRAIPPASGFRAAYAYDNLMYVLAGDVLSAAAGASWHEVVSDRILEPLGMDRCGTLPSQMLENENAARQHVRAIDGKAEPLGEHVGIADSSAPAGGMYCSLHDMARWARYWLQRPNEGLDRIGLSAQQSGFLWRGVTPKTPPVDYQRIAGTNFNLYALGWNVFDFHGELLVAHRGGLAGASTHLALLPNRDMAVIVMANSFAPEVSTLSLQLLAESLGAIADDRWIDAGVANYERRQQRVRDHARAAAADILSPAFTPSTHLSAYVGRYEDPWYGEVRISLSGNGQLFIDMSRSKLLDGPLLAVGEDEFIARWPNRGLNADARLLFMRDNGRIVGMKMRAESDTTDFSYDFEHLDFVKLER